MERRLLIFLYAIIFINVPCIGFSQARMDIIFYTISPRGVNEIDISKDSLCVKICYDFTEKKEILSKSRIVNSRTDGEYNYFSCKNVYNKYETDTGSRVSYFIFKRSSDNQFQLVGEILPFDTVENSNHKVDFTSKFYFTGYSPELMKSFHNYRNITSLDSNEIKNFVTIYTKRVVAETDKIKNTKTGDRYGTSVARELYNRTMIELKIDPTVRQDVLLSTIQKYIN